MSAFGDDELNQWMDMERRTPPTPEPPPKTSGPITYHPALIQGSDEWKAARCGLLTASEMKYVTTSPPKLETRVRKDGSLYKQREWEPAADDEKCRIHLYELLSQRITKHVEDSYISDDMLRGKEDEIYARALYAEHYAPVEDMGFITNNRWGFTLGCSPDGLVGGEGMLECKSRRQKYQTQSIIQCVRQKIIPDEFVLQVQTGLLVTERDWCDFCTYSNGMHMATIRAFPDQKIQAAIIEAATVFERRMAEEMAEYADALASGARLIPTERRIVQEMHL